MFTVHYAMSGAEYVCEHSFPSWEEATKWVHYMESFGYVTVAWVE